MIDPKSIPCPVCGANAGDPCRNTVGARIGHSHRARRNAADAAGEDAMSVVCPSCGENYSLQMATVCPFCFAWPAKKGNAA